MRAAFKSWLHSAVKSRDFSTKTLKMIFTALANSRKNTRTETTCERVQTAWKADRKADVFCPQTAGSHLQPSLTSCSLLIFLFLCLLLLSGGRKLLFLLQMLQNLFFFSFRIYFLLSHPIRDLTTDETAANRSLHCLLQTNVSRFTVYWELCWWSWKSNRTSFCLSCRLHPASAPPSSTCGDAATVASPAWWTWRCGGTLHAPPAWPGRSGRSGCRLWRTPALGSAAHTDLCWRLLTQLYVQSSFYRISRILLHGNVTVSTATVTVNTALPNTCVSTLVTFQRTENHPELQKLERSEVSSLLPHTLGVEMSFLTPFWGRAARPAQPGEGRNDLPGWNRLILPGILSLSAWNMLKLNSALKIKVSDLSLEPASTCCCVVSTQRKRADQLVRGYIWNVEVSSQLCCRQMAAQWCWLGHCYLHGDNMTTSTVRAEMEMNPHPCDLPGRLCSIFLYPLNIHTDMTSLTRIYL